MPDTPDNLLNWLVDPQYFLFANCACARVRAGQGLRI